MVNICEYLIRPGERAVARWPEGDGAGMCSGSSWPDVSVSAQVVGVSCRGARGSLGSGRSAGCAIGEGREVGCFSANVKKVNTFLSKSCPRACWSVGCTPQAKDGRHPEPRPPSPLWHYCSGAFTETRVD